MRLLQPGHGCGAAHVQGAADDDVELEVILLKVLIADHSPPCPRVVPILSVHLQDRDEGSHFSDKEMGSLSLS